MTDTIHIVADIGGTNARFACLEGESGVLRQVRVFPCAEFAELYEAVRYYLDDIHSPPPVSVCLAVAGPVESDWIDLPNNHWAFSRRELAHRLGTRLKVINDFSAQMLAVEAAPESGLHWLGANRPEGEAVRAVIGPGTGLGVSAMLPSGEILPSEGGHVAFAPADAHESSLLEVLRERFPRVSVERVLSGPGLENLYWANCRLDGVERALPAPEIAAGAASGDRRCGRALTDFFAILAAFSGDVALMTFATDGVYLSGGILPRISHLMDEGAFLDRFRDKGRFTAFVSGVPLARVDIEHPGLLGCARALYRERNEQYKTL